MSPTPLLPPAYDVVWTVLVVAELVLLTPALVQWFRSRGAGGSGALDLLAIVVIPVLGAAAYLLSRRGAARRRDRGTTAR